nr:MAG TPA: hypothetical protein [Caudoviricetes sp.]
MFCFDGCSIAKLNNKSIAKLRYLLNILLNLYLALIFKRKKFEKNRLFGRLCQFCVVSGSAGVKKARMMRAG